jgi:hypothetical protein
MPSHSEAPNGGARALGYLGLFQVTRRKGGTNSRRYRRNGYVPHPAKLFLSKQRHPQGTLQMQID